MPTLDVTTEDLDAAAAAFPATEPVFMVNLLRFRDEADYADPGLAGGLPKCSGREAYFARYMAAFNEAARPYGATQLVFGGNVVARLVGPPENQWDAIGVVQYPTFDVFRRVVTDPAYLTDAQPHRLAALADWRLFATTSLT